jgi:hypothetical protein
MKETHQTIAEEASHLAIEKTKEAQEAVELSRLAQANLAHEKAEALINKAEEVAKTLVDVSRNADERITKSLSDALRDVFGEKENSGRFIDTSRIPLICQDIKGIHGEVADIKDNLRWIVRLIIGAVVTALLGLVLIK